MPRCTKVPAILLAAVEGLLISSAWAADEAALALEPAPAGAKSATETHPPVKLLIELAAGRLGQRYDAGSRGYRRASLDLVADIAPTPGWRAVVSNRLDDVHPVEGGERSTLNSLREAFVSWQSDDAAWGVDLGRVNVRYGPGYGFNPTDYFRDGATRSVVSADPLALRENRLGTVMLRVQRLSKDGGLSVALAPKLRDRPSQDSFDADLGATNRSDRGLVTLSLQMTQRVSAQMFAFHERGAGSQAGVNGTALVGDAVVAFAEASYGRDRDFLNENLQTGERFKRAGRAVAGLTYTLPSKLALTAEFQYNGFAPSVGRWNSAVAQAGLEPLAGYLTDVQRRQDIASRRGVLVYVSQRDAAIKNLDITALMRRNVDDHSRFYWAEARYHFPRVDLAVQWQTSHGRDLTEYGSQSSHSLIQLMAAFFF